MSGLQRTPPRAQKKVEEERKSGWQIAGNGKKAGDGRGDELEKVWRGKVDNGREICPTCKTRVNSGERGVTCDRCKMWHHAECEGLSRKEYEKIVEIDEKIRWYCQDCCLLYTSPSPRDKRQSRMPSSA